MIKRGETEVIRERERSTPRRGVTLNIFFCGVSSLLELTSHNSAATAKLLRGINMASQKMRHEEGKKTLHFIL